MHNGNDELILEKNHKNGAFKIKKIFWIKIIAC